MKAVILNSTHKKPHFGCKLVTSAYEELCEARDIEILARIEKRHSPDLSICDKADIVIINAEGSIHHGKNEFFLDYAKRWPCVLINGSMEELSEGANPGGFKLVTVRESLTQSYLSDEFGIACELVPDVVFHHLPELRKVDRTCAVDRFVSDSSSKTGPDRALLVRNPQYLMELALSEEALLGRFHAICVAAMMRIPFVAWRANTWKNAGIMRDMGLGFNYRPDYEAARDSIDTYGVRIWPEETDVYVEDAHRKVNDLFDRIAQL